MQELRQREVSNLPKVQKLVIIGTRIHTLHTSEPPHPGREGGEPVEALMLSSLLVLQS